MKVHKIVNYKVKDDELETVIKAVENFIEAIRNNEPETNYQAYQLSDDVTRFVHVMSFAGTESEEKHQNADYTKAFADVLYPRCEEKPEFKDVKSVALTLGEGVVDWAN